MTLSKLRTGQARRRGFSVLELLIATTIAMVILLVVTKWFRDLSQQTSRSRALIEMSGQMRAVIAQLENDMRGATFPRGAMPGSNGSLGYIQYFEGAGTDAAPNGDLLNHLTLATTGAVTNVTSVQYVIPNGTPAGVLGSANIAGASHYQNINGSINTAVDPNTSRFGDMDDVIALTTRNTDSPFEGKMIFRQNAVAASPPAIGLPQTITSPLAEVIWWVEGFDENQDGVIADAERRLHRRTFLIRPDLSNAVNVLWHSLINNGLVNGIAGANMDTTDAMRVMYEQCDISFHIDASGNAVANSLAELSKPSNLSTAPATAWCKRITMGQVFRQIPPNPASFAGGVVFVAPFAGKTAIPGFRLLDNFVFPKTSPTTPLGQIGANRFGEDVMLSSVAAFDSRIFDPTAPIKLHSPGTQVQPGDPGFEWKQPTDSTAVTQTLVGQGAFVDLCYSHARMPNNAVSSWFSGPPSQFSGFFRVNGSNPATHLLTSYDTWAPLTNTIMDGVDNDSTQAGIIGVIDDPTEIAQETTQATTPPYNFPLRALQVTIRAYDADSKQIRQLKASVSYTND